MERVGYFLVLIHQASDEVTWWKGLGLAIFKFIYTKLKKICHLVQMYALGMKSLDSKEFTVTKLYHFLLYFIFVYGG